MAEQQRIAEVFHSFGLLRRAIRVGDAVRGCGMNAVTTAFAIPPAERARLL